MRLNAGDISVLMGLFCRLFSLVFLTLVISVAANADNTIRFATAESAPYIGRDLPKHGYVAQLVSEAFDRVGYKVVFEFSSFARAKRSAEIGLVDGFLPTHYEDSLEQSFLFSASFPGDHVGLLKRKNFPVTYALDNLNVPEVLQDLSQYKFGVVRGTSMASYFENNTALRREFVTEDLNNIDMLGRGRIDFAVVDKYIAADLMVTDRPNFIGELEFINPPLISSAFHIAFSKNTENYRQLKAEFDRGLNLLKKEGRINEILERHGFFVSKEATAGKEKLVIGAIENDDILLMKSLSRKFEERYSNIELEWRILDENTLRTRLLADLAISDSQFDIMMIGSYEVPIWAKNNWIAPLTDLPHDYDLDDIVDSVKHSLSFQNELYALPFYAESTMTFYRKDLFKKAGIKMPPNPTYQEIMAFAEAVHDPENGIYGIGLRGKPGWGQNMAFISILVNTFGGRWFDENWRPTINTSAWKEALSFYKEILDKYGHPNKIENGWYENQKLFAEGQLGILIDATSLAGRLFNSKSSKVHDQTGFDAAPIATYPNGEKWLWTWNFAIPVTSQRRAEAINFITWATSKKYIQMVANRDGWVSIPPGTRISSYRPEYQKVAPFSRLVINAIQEAKPRNYTKHPVPYSGIQFVAIPEFPAIGHQVGLKVAQFLEGKQPLEQTLKESQELVDKLMKRSGYY